MAIRKRACSRIQEEIENAIDQQPETILTFTDLLSLLASSSQQHIRKCYRCSTFASGHMEAYQFPSFAPHG